MAILRMKELKAMEPEIMKEKLAELRKELGIERGTVAGSGKASNSGKMREMRRTIARILTIFKEKGIESTGKKGETKNG